MDVYLLVLTVKQENMSSSLKSITLRLGMKCVLTVLKVLILWEDHMLWINVRATKDMQDMQVKSVYSARLEKCQATKDTIASFL